MKPKVLLHDIQYTNGGPKTVLKNIEESYLKDKFSFIRIPQSTCCGFNPVKAIKFVLHYKRLLDRERGDVFYVCGLQYTGLLMTLAGKLSNVRKVVLSVHGSDWDNPDGSVRKWILMHIVEPLEVMLADSVFTVCDAAQKTVGALRFARRNSNKGVVYNTFPDVRYNTVQVGKLRKELNIPSHKIIVTSVGRLVEAKGHQYAIEAIKQISDPDFVFVVVGDGPYEKIYKSELSDKIQNGQVFVLGSRKDVIEILRDTDIFLFTTLNENHSLALLEAVNMHCAVVATNVGGNPEVIQHDFSGILISPKSSPSVVKALYRLKDSHLRTVFSERAFQTCTEKFDVDNTLKKLEQIFSN